MNAYLKFIVGAILGLAAMHGFMLVVNFADSQAKILNHPDYVAAKAREAAGKCAP